MKNEKILISIANSNLFRNKCDIISVQNFTIGPGDLGSIPGHVIPKTLKIVLDREESRKGVAPSPTCQCSSY